MQQNVKHRDQLHEEVQRLRLMLTTQEILRHCHRDAERSEIASLKRRLADRDAQLKAVETALRDRTWQLSGALVLLGVLTLAAWF